MDCQVLVVAPGVVDCRIAMLATGSVSSDVRLARHEVIHAVEGR